MNRNREHNALKNENILAPSSLDNVVKKAQVRALKRTIRNSIIAPLSSCAAVFILFVGLVNFSPVVASAFEQIPALQKLAEFVTFSPSLSDAVEHGHVQSLKLEQVINEDLIMRVEHIILDGRQLHIFYWFESSEYNSIGEIGYSIGGRGTNSDNLPDCCINPAAICDYHDDFVPVTLILANPSDLTIGQLQYATIGFDEAVARIVIFEGEVRDISSGADTDINHSLGRYKFVIRVDEIFAGREMIEVYQEFDIAGQYLEITTVELNPIHTRINIESDWVNNTELLQRLVFYMENETGKRFYPPALSSGGLINLPTGNSGYGSSGFGGTEEDGPWRLDTHFLESAFFSESKSLTIYITGVEWIGMQWMGADTILLDEPVIIKIK